MKESSSIAHTYADQYLKTLDEDNVVLREGGMHMHIPEGATPKVNQTAQFLSRLIALLKQGCAAWFDCAFLPGWSISRHFNDDFSSFICLEEASAE